MLSSFAKPDKTKEQLKDYEKKRKTARVWDPRTQERKTAREWDPRTREQTDRDRDPRTRGDTVPGRTDQSYNGRARTRECVDSDSGDEVKQARESTFHARSRTRSGEVLRRCRRARGEEEGHDVERVIVVRRFVKKSDGEQVMKALKDAEAKALEGVARFRKGPHCKTPWGQGRRSRHLGETRCDRGRKFVVLVESYLVHKILGSLLQQITKFSVKIVNLETIIDMQSWCRTWPLNGSSRILAKQKLLRRHKGACKSSWSPIGSPTSCHLH